MKKRLATLLMVCAAMIGSTCINAAEAPEVFELPELTEENQDEIFAAQKETYLNSETVVPMLWQGFLKMNVPVGETTRPATVYIPENLPIGSLCVMMNVPDGVEDAAAFLQDSGWAKKADEERIWLIAAEPIDGKWGTIEEESEYLNAVYSSHRAQVYFRGNLSMYVVGYGEIGQVFHERVMADPLYTAAAVFMDASDLSSDYLAEYKEKSLDTEANTYGIDYKDVPVPMWISNAEETDLTSAVEDYWKEAAGVSETPSEDDVYGSVYLQDKDTLYTPEGNIVQVAVQNAEHDYTAPETTEEISDFLLQFFRCGAGGPYGNMISNKIDYDEMGVEHVSFTDSNEIPREYLVYVPEDLRDSSEAYPVVFNFHGAKSSMRNAFEESMWYKIADENHFALVMPEASLNGKTIGWKLDETDNDFINELLDRVIEDYNADTNRLYYTGHSMGIMLCNYALSSETSHRFAAIGGTSSGLMSELLEGGTQTIPYWLTLGQYDLWSYDINEESVPTDALNEWLIRDGLADADTVVDVRTTGMSEEITDGRYHHMIWNNEQDLPLVRFTWIEGKDHMNTYAENCMLWNDWFSHWTLGEDGVRSYDGTAIAAAE